MAATGCRDALTATPMSAPSTIQATGRVDRSSTTPPEKDRVSSSATREDGPMGMDITNDTDPDEGPLAARIDQVRNIVRAYIDTPSRQHAITDVDDLYDEQTGLPR